MSYEPTEWQNGDTITSAKLNNIESGVSEVNSEYTPTNWQNGDVITADKLNNIEQGIVNAAGGGIALKACGIHTGETNPIIMSHPVDPETGDLNLNVIAPVYIRNSTEECPLIGKAREDGKVVYYITYDGGFIPSNITVRPEDGYTYEIAGGYIMVVGPGYDLGEENYPLAVTVSGSVSEQ